MSKHSISPFAKYAAVTAGLSLGLLTPCAQAASGVWVPTAGGTYGWNSNPNWTGASFPNATNQTAGVNINILGNQIINLNQAIAVSTLSLGDSTLSSGVFNDIEIAPNGAFSLQVGSGDLSSQNGNNTVSAGVVLGAVTGVAITHTTAAGSLTLTGGISHGSNAALDIGGAGNVTVSTNGISIGTGALTKVGAGTLTLAAASSYTGGTIIGLNAGTVKLANAAALGSAGSAVTLSSGATLQYASDSAINAYNLTIPAAAGGVNVVLDRATAGAAVNQTIGTLNFGGASAGQTLTATIGANVTSGAPVLTINSVIGPAVSTRSAHFAGDVDYRIGSMTNGSASGTVEMFLDGTSLNNEVTGIISDNGVVAKTAITIGSGAGVWTLSGTNTYTGPTSINGGVLQAVDGIGLSAGSLLQLRGGVFQTAGTFSRTLGSAAGNVNWGSASGGFAAKGGVLNLNLNGGTGSVIWGSSSFVQTGQSLIFGSSTADNLVDFQNGLNLGGSGSSTRSIIVRDNASSTADRARISGAISGVAGQTLLKDGAGTLELTAVNTYSGSTAVSAGTLLVSGAGSINNSADVSITSASARFRYDSSVGLTRNVTVTGGGTFAHNSSADYSGVFTFTNGKLGGTNWNGGLGGLTIGANQTISPGNSPGTASTSTQTWATAGSYDWEINQATGGTPGADPGWDLLTLTGDLSITATSGGKFNINIISLTSANVAGNAAGFNAALNYNWLIADSANAITTFSADAFALNLAGFSNSYTGTFTIARGDTIGVIGADSTQLYLVYTVPEPTTTLLLGTSGLLLFLMRRRRAQ